MKLKRLIYLILGCICLGLGCVGIALPILPTVPFFLVTVFCFGQSSQKLHDWFVGTKMYKKHLESFVKKKGMTVKTKVGIIIPVTLLMGLGFFMMMRKALWAPCIILLVVWVCHIIYFLFGVKTIAAGDMKDEVNFAERYPYSRTLRVSEIVGEEDVQKLMKIFDGDHMKATIDQRAKTLTVHMDTPLSDEALWRLIRNAGFQYKTEKADYKDKRRA